MPLLGDVTGRVMCQQLASDVFLLLVYSLRLDRVGCRRYGAISLGKWEITELCSQSISLGKWVISLRK